MDEGLSSDNQELPRSKGAVRGTRLDALLGAPTGTEMDTNLGRSLCNERSPHATSTLKFHLHIGSFVPSLLHMDPS